MKLGQIARILSADVLCGQDKLEDEVQYAFGSDLMSDVLAFVKGRTVLLTGMTNAHVVRTSELLDIGCIVFVRGKVPTEDIVEMADDSDIAVLCTAHTLYTASGLLYEQGLRSEKR